MTETYETLEDLYRAARRAEEPSLEDRRAVRALVLSAAAAASLATATTSVTAAPFAAGSAASASAASASVVGTAAGSVGAAKIAAWVLIGFALGSATSATSVVISARSGNGSARGTVPQALAPSRGSSSAHRVRVGDAVLPAQPPSVVPLVEASAPQVEQRERPAGARSFQRSTRATDHEKAPGAASGASLSDETRALARVQHALNEGDANRALELLARDAVRFESGSLGEERAAARVLALCTAGREAEARTAQRRFAADYPRSALAQRVLATCSEPR